MAFPTIPKPSEKVLSKLWFQRNYYAVVPKGIDNTQFYGNWVVKLSGIVEGEPVAVVDEHDGTVIPWNDVKYLRFPLEEKQILELLNPKP